MRALGTLDLKPWSILQQTVDGHDMTWREMRDDDDNEGDMEVEISKAERKKLK